MDSSPNSSVSLPRRELLKAGALAAGAGLFGTNAAAQASDYRQSAAALDPPPVFDTPISPNRKRTLRLAHLTDVHVQPELAADRGLAKVLHLVQEVKDKPEFILYGGDCIMDSFGQTRERTQLQWDLWKSILKQECSLPSAACIGNHDVWGWEKSKSGATGDEPLYGKQWAVEALGLKRRYYSFDKAGWRFVVLDSTHPSKFEAESYEARLDEEQFAWLQDELKATPATKPILILSHIPILTATSFFDGENEKSGRAWVIPGSWMHLDARRIAELFWQHRNVRLCLSGHMHLYDRTEYNGVTYLCSGAVCGNWWEGNYHQCPPGYSIIDLFDDGSFQLNYTGTGWAPVKG